MNRVVVRGRPVGRHSLVGPAPEDQRLRPRAELLAECPELRSPGDLVKAEVPRLRPLEAPVHRHQVPDDDLAHAFLPTDCDLQVVAACPNRSYFASSSVEGGPLRNAGRSGCPINLTLEVFGDRWSLIVLRDIMFGNRRHFRELLQDPRKASPRTSSPRGSSTSSQSASSPAPTTRDHKQKATYSLTEAGDRPRARHRRMSAPGASGTSRSPPSSRPAPATSKTAGGLSSRPSPPSSRHLHLAAPAPDRSVLAEFARAFAAARAEPTSP